MYILPLYTCRQQEREHNKPSIFSPASGVRVRVPYGPVCFFSFSGDDDDDDETRDISRGAYGVLLFGESSFLPMRLN